MPSCAKCKKEKRDDSFISKYGNQNQTRNCMECRERLLLYYKRRKEGTQVSREQIVHKKSFRHVLRELIKNHTVKMNTLGLLREYDGEHRKCTQCRVERSVVKFIRFGKLYKQCIGCRERGIRSSNRHKEVRREGTRKWKENNKERIKAYNDSRRNGKNWTNVRTEMGFSNPSLEGIPSNRRKQHIVVDGIIGKKCSKCKEWKPLEEGYNNCGKHWDNKRVQCKECLRLYRENIPNEIRNQKQAIYVKQRKQRDVDFKMRLTLRSRLGTALFRQKAKKLTSTLDLVGCSIEYLREYLETKFQEGMTWDNHGEWHIDHIRPCVSFDLSILEQQRECFHYTNLQPLWASDNLSKGSSWEKE